MGATAYKLINSWSPTGGSVVEIGSERGEGSTSFLSRYCQLHNLPFYTVDSSQKVYENAQKIVGDQAFHQRGEDFLKEVFPRIDDKICFLYLDNFDWLWEGVEKEEWAVNQVNDYKSMGLEMNNKNSQKTHMEQAVLADKFIIPGGYVLIDDTWQTGPNKFSGKGGLAVPALLKLGYSIINRLEPIEEDKEGFVCLLKV